MATIEIDGKTIDVDDGAMLIEVADAEGIHIPRFCYHKKLSVAANCRMCLVEVEKAPKPLPACATPVSDGMKVFTRSPRALAAQRGTMEFLLINHPLDCPICDQGGECQLQETSIGYGNVSSQYQEQKRVVTDPDIGPLIHTDMTRCIHCTLCVRFGDEIAGEREMGATGRGENMRIGTYIDKSINSEMSGNVIDLCPVGALTSKPYRYTARAWELSSMASIAPHDSVGSNTYIHSLNGEVKRVLPRENEDINEVWLSDRDRFAYEALNSDQRLTRPMIKKDGQWQETDWNSALEYVVNGLKAVTREHGAKQLGALISPQATLEEMYLLQKMMRGLGSHNIDHRLQRMDFQSQEQEPVAPYLGCTIAQLEDLDAFLLVGSNVRKEQPIIGHRLRKAVVKGAAAFLLNPIDYAFNFPIAGKLISSQVAMEFDLAGIAKALMADKGDVDIAGLDILLADIAVTSLQREIAQQLKAADKAMIFVGNMAAAHPASSTLYFLAQLIADLAGCNMGYLQSAANSAGANIAGVLPHRGVAGQAMDDHGLNAQEIGEQPLKAYILHGIEPGYDCVNPAQMLKALNQADFVLSMSMYSSDALKEYADVILPIAAYTETSGTYVNTEGLWQAFRGAVNPVGDSRPAWKIYRVLGNLLQLPGFDYNSTEDVIAELTEQCGSVTFSNAAKYNCPSSLSQKNGTLLRIGDVPALAMDAMVRRATALQQTQDAVAASIRMNSVDIAALDLQGQETAVAVQGECRSELPLFSDARVPQGVVWLQAGLAGTEVLGAAHGPIVVTRKQ